MKPFSLQVVPTLRCGINIETCSTKRVAFPVVSSETRDHALVDRQHKLGCCTSTSEYPKALEAWQHLRGRREDAYHRKVPTLDGSNRLGQIHQSPALGVNDPALLNKAPQLLAHAGICR